MVADLARGSTREDAFGHACITCRIPEVSGFLRGFRDHEPDPALDALLATHCALTVFMEAMSLEDAVVRAVNMGGDADTIGAVTGALAGAYWGATAIPLHWRVQLRDHDRIIDLAGDLFRVAVERGE
jgi:ADP-ribosyl-[dinitrogen reductase] hydrolase